jgi:hypothetical protein
MTSMKGQYRSSRRHKNNSSLHLANFSSALLTPIVTTVHLQYQSAGHRFITTKEGSELG